MAKIPAVRTAVFADKLTTAGLAQRANNMTRGLDIKSRAPFPAQAPVSNVTPRKTKL